MHISIALECRILPFYSEKWLNYTRWKSRISSFGIWRWPVAPRYCITTNLPQYKCPKMFLKLHGLIAFWCAQIPPHTTFWANDANFAISAHLVYLDGERLFIYIHSQPQKTVVQLLFQFVTSSAMRSFYHIIPEKWFALFWMCVLIALTRCCKLMFFI